MKQHDANGFTGDIKAYAVGFGSIFGFSLADVAQTAQQIGVIFGALVVFVTLLHRILLFWRDIVKK